MPKWHDRNVCAYARLRSFDTNRIFVTAPPVAFNVMQCAPNFIDTSRHSNHRHKQRSCNYFCTFNVAINFPFCQSYWTVDGVAWKGYTCKQIYVRLRVNELWQCVPSETKINVGSRHAHTFELCTTYFYTFKVGTDVAQCGSWWTSIVCILMAVTSTGYRWKCFEFGFLSNFRQILIEIQWNFLFTIFLTTKLMTKNKWKQSKYTRINAVAMPPMRMFLMSMSLYRWPRTNRLKQCLFANAD